MHSPLSPSHSGASALTLDSSAANLSLGADAVPLSPAHGGGSALLSPSATAPPKLTAAQMRQRALEFEKEILADIDEVTVQVMRGN